MEICTHLNGIRAVSCRILDCTNEDMRSCNRKRQQSRRGRHRRSVTQKALCVFAFSSSSWHMLILLALAHALIGNGSVWFPRQPHGLAGYRIISDAATGQQRQLLVTHHAENDYREFAHNKGNFRQASVSTLAQITFELRDCVRSSVQGYNAK